MIRLYIDEDSMTTAVIVALRRRGTDVLLTSEAGMKGKPDDEQLEFSCREGRTLFTANSKDFGPLHRAYMESGRHHFGIVLNNSQSLTIAGQVRSFTRLLSEVSAEEMEDRVVFLRSWR